MTERLDEIPVELNSRRSDGIEVFLMWYRKHNVLSIMLDDMKANPPVHTEFFVPNDKGVEAFEHPYAWLPHGHTES